MRLQDKFDGFSIKLVNIAFNIEIVGVQPRIRWQGLSVSRHVERYSGQAGSTICACMRERKWINSLHNALQAARKLYRA